MGIDTGFYELMLRRADVVKASPVVAKSVSKVEMKKKKKRSLRGSLRAKDLQVINEDSEADAHTQMDMNQQHNESFNLSSKPLLPKNSKRA